MTLLQLLMGLVIVAVLLSLTILCLPIPAHSRQTVVGLTLFLMFLIGVICVLLAWDISRKG